MIFLYSQIIRLVSSVLGIIADADLNKKRMYIENGLSTLNLGEKMLIDSQDLDNVSISIGVQSHIASFYLLDIISKFQKDFPNAHINL